MVNWSTKHFVFIYISHVCQPFGKRCSISYASKHPLVSNKSEICAQCKLHWQIYRRINNWAGNNQFAGLYFLYVWSIWQVERGQAFCFTCLISPPHTHLRNVSPVVYCHRIRLCGTQGGTCDTITDTCCLLKLSRLMTHWESAEGLSEKVNRHQLAWTRS